MDCSFCQFIACNNGVIINGKYTDRYRIISPIAGTMYPIIANKLTPKIDKINGTTEK